MNYRIPPIGYCATCLAALNEERPAFALWRGTGLCADHLGAVLAPDPHDHRDDTAGALDE